MCCGTHVRNLSQVQVNWFSLCSLILVIHYSPRSLRIMERSFQFSWTPAIIINEYCMCPCKFNLIGNLSSIIWLFALATSVYTDVFWEVQGFTSCFLILLSRTTSRTLLLFSFISLLFRIPAFHTFLIPHSASVTLFIWLLDNNNYYFLLARIQRIKKSTSAEHYRWKKNKNQKIPCRKVFFRSGDTHKVKAVTVPQKMRHAKMRPELARRISSWLLTTFNPFSPAKSSETFWRRSL